MSEKRLAALALGASLIALACPAAAQIAPVDQKTGTDAGATDEKSNITVTGSRIRRDGTEAPTPLTIVASENIEARAPSGLAQSINQLPSFLGSVNSTQTQVLQGNRVRTGNYLNLRGLGPARVLVLQDGYRLPATGNNGGVDVDVIPQMLIDRVEVVTGGASAIYGSDAVSGVVNFVFDDKFKGLRTLSQAGISTYHDAGSFRLGAAAGLGLLDDRLRLHFSAEHYASDGIAQRVDRPGGGDKWITGGRDPTLATGLAGTVGNPFLDYANVNLSISSYGGLITAGPAALKGMQFLSTGQLGAFNPGTSIGRSGYGQGGDGIDFCTTCNLAPRISSSQFFARADFDISPSLKLFVQGSYNHGWNRTEGGTLVKTAFTIFNDNYYLRQQLTPAQLTALGTSDLTISRAFADWQFPGTRPKSFPNVQSSNSYIFRTGVSGKLFDDWSWDALYEHGYTRFENRSIEPRNDLFLAAIDAVAGPNGQPVCRITLTNPTILPNCKPINVLGVGRGDPAAIASTFDESYYAAVNQIDLGAINMSGSPFSTWAGPVKVAIGGEIRHQKLTQESNSNPLVPVDYTGIRGGSGQRFFQIAVGVANGAYTVKEGYAEVEIPLAKDVAFAHALELNGAVRYTDYSTSGGVTTYKVGGNWEPINGLRFRSTYSRDIRAPSLFELYAGQTQTPAIVFDPRNGATATVSLVTGGNARLVPERATTYTIGGVFSSAAIPGFYASADYFNIEINNAIATPGNALQVVQACASNPASDSCRYIEYDANGAPAIVRGTNQNAAAIALSGIDFELGYRKRFDFGTVSLRALGTRLISLTRQETDTSKVIEYAGSADMSALLASTQPLPNWQGSVQLGFETDTTRISVQERIIGGYKKSFQTYYVYNDVPPIAYTDLSITQGVNAYGGRFDLFFTVNNLLNQEGPFFVTDQNTGTQLPTARVIYDIVGRYFTVGVKTRF